MKSFYNWFDISVPDNATPGTILCACIGHFHDMGIGVAVPANYVPGHVSLFIFLPMLSHLGRLLIIEVCTWGTS
jgi:hypothetical protein